MFSNRYIFIYASVMVIIVAAVLSTASNLLKPFQERNIRVEKMISLLASANITSNRDNVEQLYQKQIIAELVIDLEGTVTDEYRNGEFITGSERAFDINLKEELKAKQQYDATGAGIQPKFPLFVSLSQSGNDTNYIIPLLGKGLWGPIYGYLAMKDDLNTVAGAYFGQDKETPGLGAEISQKPFMVQFENKSIFDDQGNFVSIKVVKGGVANSNIDPKHGVDAISGGTITSNGVTDMLEDCLENYVPYIKKQQ